MKVFTPADQTPFPVQRGDHILHRVLRRGEPYLLTDSAGEQWLNLIRGGLASGRIEDAPDRSKGKTGGKHLFFMDGDVGDAVVARAVVAARMTQATDGKSKWSPENVGFVTPHGDWSLLPFAGCPVFEFPISLREAEGFTFWGEFNFRTKGDIDPVAWFGRYLGVSPKEPLWSPAIPSLEYAIGGMLPQTGRPRIGLCPTTRSHYRSWYGQHACVVAAGLVEAGYDCYFLGPLNHRIEFRREGVENPLWGEGLYDLQGRFGTVEEHVAAIANMDAVIAPDGGDLLIACALQKPTLGLFWCTRGERYLPYAPLLRCMNATRECSPCWCNGDRAPCEEAYCLGVSTIDPEDVVKATQSMLDGGRR